MNTLAKTHPLASGLTTGAPLVRALQGYRPQLTPVWFMRQAGRSLPEYRALRTGRRMLDTCLEPATASEITLQPVRRHGVDAAVFFSDIVVPLALAGVDVDIVPGRGPVFSAPVRTMNDVKRAREECSPDRLREALGPIREAVRLTIAELGSTPLIGFAGAPFTLAAYLVEGGPSRDHLRARSLMHSEPETWRELLSWTADLSSVFLEAQVEAGASAVQLFDSWAGSLGAAEYREHVAQASHRALEGAKSFTYSETARPELGPTEPRATEPRTTERGTTERGVPIIHFAVGSGHLLTELASVGVSALGVDWRTPLDEASRILGDQYPLQGNINPAYLEAPPQVLEAHVRDVLERGRRAPGHVLNLGHGVPPETDPTVLTRIVELTHAQ